MYFPYFIAYICVGFVITLVVFLWALKSGQFSDQKRARFLPLEEELEARPEKASKIRRIEVYALFILAVGGLALIAAVLIFALTHGGQPAG